MTPFDRIALLTMLLTFYPVVSVAELQRARRERPEYFAGGVLFGTVGEKLRLPDGRVFDLIYDASGPVANRRWQVIEPGPGGDDGPFALEPGPLRPIDVDADPSPAPSSTFLPLMVGTLGQLGASDVHLEDAQRALVAAGVGNEVDAAYDDDLAPAAASIGGDALELEGLNVAELLEQSDGLEGTTDDHASNYPDESDTPDAPTVTDPGAPPDDSPIEEPPPPAA